MSALMERIRAFRTRAAQKPKAEYLQLLRADVAGKSSDRSVERVAVLAAELGYSEGDIDSHLEMLRKIAEVEASNFKPSEVDKYQRKVEELAADVKAVREEIDAARQKLNLLGESESNAQSYLAVATSHATILRDLNRKGRELFGEAW